MSSEVKLSETKKTASKRGRHSSVCGTPTANGKMDILEGFCWHSSLGISGYMTGDGNERFITRMANTKEARSQFVKAGDDLLIHKATKCLWKLSDDGKSIVPVFASDVLSEEEALEACK